MPDRFRLTIPPAFRICRFAIYWVGMVFAWGGTQMMLWTALWQIRTLTDQPAALGIVGLIKVVPTILVSLSAGLVADRFNRRNVLFVTQGVMALVSLALVALGERIQLWHIYALVASWSLAFSYDLPARQSLVPNLVPDEDLSNALSLQTISFTIGGLAGPALSGVLIARFGIGTAYSISAVFQGVMLLALVFIGPVGQKYAAAARSAGSRRANSSAIREGVDFTFKNPLILSSMLLDFFATFLTRADPLMPIVANDILHVGPVEYGWLASGQAAGSAIAGLALAQVHTIRRQGRVLLISVALIGVGAVLFGASRSFPLTLLALMLIGGADAVSSIIRNTLRQLETPDEMRGRMTGVNQIFFMGGPQLGEWKSGLLGQWIGVPPAIMVGGLACILVTGAVGIRWPQLRMYAPEEAA